MTWYRWNERKDATEISDGKHGVGIAKADDADVCFWGDD